MAMETTTTNNSFVIFLIATQILIGLSFELLERCQEECVRLKQNEMSCVITAKSLLDNCMCDNGCFRDIVVPPNVTSVTIRSQSETTEIKQDSFQGNWMSVQHLVIDGWFGSIDLFPNAFLQLGSLESLTISGLVHVGPLSKMSKSCFYSSNGVFKGLENLLYLNLEVKFQTKCFEYIVNALGESNIMEKLKIIQLDATHPDRDPNNHILDYFSWTDFFRSVSKGRQLDLLTLTDFHISDFHLENISCLGLISEELSITHSKIDTIYLDLNNSKVNFRRVTFVNTNIAKLDFGKDMTPICLLRDIQLFLLERLETSVCPKFTLSDLEHLSVCYQYFINDVAYDCWQTCNPDYDRCSLRLDKIADDSSMVRMVARGLISQTKIFDLARMNITYISAEILPEHLSEISLSDNNLGAMQSNEEKEFHSLFKRFTNLSMLNLDRNQLSNLPIDIFSKNVQLKILSLSGNYLQTFNLKLEYVMALELVDLSKNNIQIVDGSTQNTINRMIIGYKLKLEIDMSGNPYKCSCDEESFDSIKWLKSFNKLDFNNEKYTCYLNGQTYNIHLNSKVYNNQKSALSATQEYCAHQEKVRLLMISLTSVGIFTVVCVLGSLIVKRYIDKKRKLNNLLNQIQNNELPWQYLVFLSFCSDDDEFVINIIYPQLKRTLADITKTDIELICVGDRHFIPGRPLGGQIVDAIGRSAVMLAVVSENYCKRNWCQTEIMEAYGTRKPILMVMKEHVRKQLMGECISKIFNRYTHASWKPDDNGGHIEPDWPDLGKAIIELATTATIEDVSDQEDEAAV